MSNKNTKPVILPTNERKWKRFKHNKKYLNIILKIQTKTNFVKKEEHSLI